MGRLKKTFTFLLCILTVMTFSAWGRPVFADSGGTGDIGVYINGTAVDFPDAKPFLSDGRTYVPARFVSEQLGAAINWDSDTKVITIKNGSDTFKLTVGSTKVTKNGSSVSMDAAPMLTDGRTMVPLRFVSEQLGATVKWDDSGNSVQISTTKIAADYTIKSGDTLWDIASRYGVSLTDLTAANPDLDPSRLAIGQKIDLPSGAASAGRGSHGGIGNTRGLKRERADDLTGLHSG